MRHRGSNTLLVPINDSLRARMESIADSLSLSLDDVVRLSLERGLKEMENHPLTRPIYGR